MIFLTPLIAVSHGKWTDYVTFCFALFSDAGSSTVREDGKFREIFKAAGLRMIKRDVQKGLLTNQPGRRLFPVHTYALRPEAKPIVSSEE